MACPADGKVQHRRALPAALPGGGLRHQPGPLSLRRDRCRGPAAPPGQSVACLKTSRGPQAASDGADRCADVVYCVDVLEHVADLDGVISETARALKPGSLYLFDTMNQTP